MSRRFAGPCWFALVALALAPLRALAATDSGAFVMTVGRDTIALERFTRTGDVVEGTLLYVPASLRFDYSITLLADGSVQRMENAVRSGVASASAAPTQ